MKHLAATLAAGLAIAASPALADEPLYVQVPATLDASAPIPPAVKSECGVDMLLGNHVFSAIGRRDSGTQLAPSQAQAGNGRFLQLTVLSVHGFGGGAWSGAKSMTIRADLKQGASLVRSTVLSRSSSGGAFAAFKGTCEILDRVATALGKDVAKWVALPDGPPSGPDIAASAPTPGVAGQTNQPPINRP